MSNRNNGYGHNAYTPSNVEQQERSAPVSAIVDQNGQPYGREEVAPSGNVPARTSSPAKSSGNTSPRDRGLLAFSSSISPSGRDEPSPADRSRSIRVLVGEHPENN